MCYVLILSDVSVLQSKGELEHQIDEINAGRPQCPVGLNTLVLPRKNTLTVSEKQPYVYLNCGHVHGQHDWGASDEQGDRTCPMCRMVSHFLCSVLTLITVAHWPKSSQVVVGYLDIEIGSP